MRARIRDRFASSTTTHLGRNRTRHPHRNPAQGSPPCHPRRDPLRRRRPPRPPARAQSPPIRRRRPARLV